MLAAPRADARYATGDTSCCPLRPFGVPGCDLGGFAQDEGGWVVHRYVKGMLIVAVYQVNTPNFNLFSPIPRKYRPPNGLGENPWFSRRWLEPPSGWKRAKMDHRLAELGGP